MEQAFWKKNIYRQDAGQSPDQQNDDEYIRFDSSLFSQNTSRNHKANTWQTNSYQLNGYKYSI